MTHANNALTYLLYSAELQARTNPATRESALRRIALIQQLSGNGQAMTALDRELTLGSVQESILECKEGANAGKPGPCPEHKSSPTTTRTAGFRAKIWKAAKKVLKLANAAPEFAKLVVEKAGWSKRVGKAALIFSTIGDYLIPGIPAASALVIIAATIRKPMAPIRVVKDLIDQARGKPVAESLLEAIDRELLVGVGNWLHEAEEEGRVEWAITILSVAMQKTRGRLRPALELAKRVLENHPQPPGRSVTESLLEATDAEEEDPRERAQMIADLLQRIYGDDALGLFEEAEDVSESLLEAWNPEYHPRGKNGRFIKRNSQEAVDAAHEAIHQALRQPRSKESLNELLNHLNLLTTGQILDLKKKYGLRGSGKAKAELVAKIAERLDKGRREEPAEQPPATDEGATGKQDLQVGDEGAAKGKEPWEMTKGELIAAYKPGGKSGGKTPWTGDTPKPGELRIDPDLGTLEKAVSINLADVKLREPIGPGDPRMPDVERYAQWMKDGYTPPPLSAVQGRDGKPVVLNNRRVEAAKLAGVKSLMAWMEMTGEDGAGLSHRQAVASALAAGKPVPPEVLADYPDLAAKYDKAEPVADQQPPPVSDKGGSGESVSDKGDTQPPPQKSENSPQTGVDNTDTSRIIDSGVSEPQSTQTKGDGTMTNLQEPRDSKGVPPGHTFLGTNEKNDYPYFVNHDSGKVFVRGVKGNLEEFANSMTDFETKKPKYFVPTGETAESVAEKKQIELQQKGEEENKQRLEREKQKKEREERSKQEEEDRRISKEKMDKERAEIEAKRKAEKEHLQANANAYDADGGGLSIKTNLESGKSHLTVNSYGKSNPGYIAKITSLGGPYGMNRDFISPKGSMGETSVEVGDGVYELQNTDKRNKNRHYVLVKDGKVKQISADDVSSHVEESAEQKALNRNSARKPTGPAISHETEHKPQIGEIIMVGDTPHVISKIGKSRYLSRDFLDDVDDFGAQPGWRTDVEMHPVQWQDGDPETETQRKARVAKEKEELRQRREKVMAVNNKYRDVAETPEDTSGINLTDAEQLGGKTYDADAWYIKPGDGIYKVVYNGRDGDDWSYNNWAGNTSVLWKAPYSEELADEIRGMFGKGDTQATLPKAEDSPQTGVDNTDTSRIIDGGVEKPQSTPTQGDGTMATETNNEMSPLKKKNRQPISAHEMGKPGRLTIQGETKPIKEKLKAKGWHWDAKEKNWYMSVPAAEADAIRRGGEERIAAIKKLGAWSTVGLISLNGFTAFVGKDHPEASVWSGETTAQKQTGNTITVNSGSRDVDAYLVGRRIRKGDKLYVVTGYNRRQDDQGGYVHTMDVRPATPEEEKESRIADIKAELRKMSIGGPDDIEKGVAAHQAKEKALRDELQAKEPQSTQSQGDEMKKQAEQVRKDNHGTLGEDHPLKGLSRKEQDKKLGQLVSKADNLERDPQKVGTGMPVGFDKSQVETTIRDIIDAHFQEKKVGIPLDQLYEKSKSLGMSKQDFQKALVSMHYDNTVLRLSGWPRMIAELPDPELAPIVGSKLMYYARPA